MNVHEDVAFDPGVRAVEVQAIIGSAVKDIVDELDNRTGAITTREVDGIVEPPGMAEVIIAENAVTRGGNPVHPVKAFRPGRRRVTGKIAILHNERTVLNDRSWRPGAVVDEDDRAIDVDLCVMAVGGRRSTARIKVHIS